MLGVRYGKKGFEVRAGGRWVRPVLIMAGPQFVQFIGKYLNGGRYSRRFWLNQPKNRNEDALSLLRWLWVRLDPAKCKVWRPGDRY